jgi:23S rRNA (guanosine2251-2'-O)-methyltransferase
VCKAMNMASTIDKLKKRGLWIIGSDMEGTQAYDIDMKGPIALVIGSEDKGIRRLVLEKCDLVAKLPMLGKLNSLNASVAAGVLMYEAVRQRSIKR